MMTTVVDVVDVHNTYQFQDGDASKAPAILSFPCPLLVV